MPKFDRSEFDPEPGEGGGERRRSHEGESDDAQWLRRADDQRRRGLYENALRYYSRALERDESLVNGWLGQIQMLILLGENTEAELWARGAQPDVDPGWNIAGVVLGGLSEYLSLVVGFTGLLLIACAYYLLSAVLAPRSSTG